jgi:serine/threonine-protein kinase RsbW
MPNRESVERTVRLSAPPADVNDFHDFLADVWALAPGVSDIDRISLETALVELAANVLRHADGEGAGLTCELTISVDDHAISVAMRDTGEPGDIALLDLEMPALDAESGRGLPLIDALVDEVEHRHDGEHNHWRLVRRRRT